MKSPDRLGPIAEIDLVAYLLHELSPQQELAIRTALTLDPSLAAKANAIAATLSMFDRQEYPTMIGTEVLDNHWQRLRPSLTPHRRRPAFPAWLLPVTFAASVTLLLVIAFLFSSWNSSTSLSSAPQQAVSPQVPSSAPGPSSPSPVPPSAHASIALAPASQQRETQPNPQALPRISIPSIEPDFESAPLNTNLAFATIPNELLLPVTPPSSSTIPTPPSSALSSTPPPAKRRHIQTDFSVGVFGNLIAARTETVPRPAVPMFTAQGGSSSQSASPSAGVVGSFHQQFGPWLGYRVTSSYARNTFAYSDSTFITGSPYAISSNELVNGSTYELTVAYTVKGPSSKRISTDAEVGVGALLIEPSSYIASPPNVFPPLEHNHRRTALGGVGFNFKLTPRLDLRAEYRTLVYSNPGFGFSPHTRVTTSSEPTVGLTYHFGSTNNK